MILSNFLSIALALVIIFFAYFVFGLYLVEKLRPKATFVESLLTGYFLSISLSTALIAILALFVGTSAYFLLWVFAFLGLLKLNYFRRRLGPAIKQVGRHKTILAFILLATLSLSSTLFLSGVERGDDYQYQETHDNAWHLALIKELKANFPPNHPSFNQIKLTNYHYFYDLSIAEVAKLTNAPIDHLYFRLSAPLIALLLFSSAATLGYKLDKRRGALWMVFLTGFTGSFAYLIPFFIKGNGWHESSFWVSQTFAMLLNPQIIFSLGLTYMVATIIYRTKKLTLREHLLLIMLIAPSVGFKSYSWVVLSLIYALVILRELLQTKNLRTIGYGPLFLLVSLPFLWLITGFQSGTFVYEPLWFINSMVTAPDRLNNIIWVLQEDHYRLKGNILRVIQIKTQEIAIFYLGNLGIRSAFIALLTLAIAKKIQQKDKSFIMIIFVGFLFFSIFPLIFIQDGVIWNSIQFWYFSLIFANILTVIVIKTLASKGRRLIKLALTITLILTAIPTYIKFQSHRLTSFEHIDSALVAKLKTFDESDRISICHEDSLYYRTELVSFLTKANVYLSDPVQIELVREQTDVIKNYENLYSDFDMNRKIANLRDFFKDNKINILICSDGDRKTTLDNFVDNYDRSATITEYDNVKVYQLSEGR